MLLKSFRFLIVTFFLLVGAKADEVVFAQRTIQIVTASSGVIEFTVEIADNEEKHARGLMHRKSMDENHGMLFLFEKEREVNMWMKNTYIPLDVIFIKKDKSVLKIVENASPMSLERIASDGNVAAVLEINAGICKKYGIKKDDRVAF